MEHVIEMEKRSLVDSWNQWDRNGGEVWEDEGGIGRGDGGNYPWSFKKCRSRRASFPLKAGPSPC